MSRCQIMVIEDDQDIREQVKNALEFEGYTVKAATNGKEGLEYLESLGDDELPQCILLDLMMPVMSGPEFIQNIRAKDRYQNINVIIATAKGRQFSPEDIPGTVKRIQKPFDLDELYSTIETFCK